MVDPPLEIEFFKIFSTELSNLEKDFLLICLAILKGYILLSNNISLAYIFPIPAIKL